MLTKDKIKIELGDVQETLLLPLYLRARETQRPDAIIRDPRALEMVEAIDYEFTPCDKAKRLQLDVAIRTEVLDEQVRRFIERHPRATIVNLGAGLDGRFWRVDNGQIRWLDLDLPDSIELRRRFYSESDRNRFLAKSMFDYSWFDDLGRTPDEPVLLVAEGLVHYFEERQMKEFFAAVADHLPGAEFLFHSISPLLVNKQGAIHGLNRTQAVFKWGIWKGEQITRWDPRYEVLGVWSFLDRYPQRWGWLRWFTFLPWFGQFAKATLKVVHVRFNPAGS